MKNNYKVIVVGSGPGASVAGYEIAASGIDVLMLESGEDFRKNLLSDYSTDELSLKYRNGGQTVSLGSPMINYAEGACLGGGSEVNSGLFHRIPNLILDNWEESNSLFVDRDDLSEAFNEIESEINVSLMPESQMPLASSLLKKGADSLGWDCQEIPRWIKYSKASSEKQGMTKNFIPRFEQAGGKLECNVKVLSISKAGNNSIILQVMKNQDELTTYTCEYLFLGAGSISTPSLLQRSGIKKNVGHGLQMHPSFKVIAEFDNRINFAEMGVPVHQIKEFSPDISIGCSISSKPYIGLGLVESNSSQLLSKWQNMSSYYVMVSPKTRGFVKNIPFFDSPFVFYNLLKEDKIMLKKGIGFLAEVLFETGAKNIFSSMDQVSPISSLESFNSKLLKISIKDLNLMTIHLFSSMPMGGNKVHCPTSPEGNLWEHSNIYISDSSMLCGSPSVNPQATIMAFAKLNARRFLQGLKHEF